MLKKYGLLLFFACFGYHSGVFGSESGLYLLGLDQHGVAVNNRLNGLLSDIPIACVNCHRLSGLGTSESGKSIPPVRWSILGSDLPLKKYPRFLSMQNRRKAYTEESFYRLLTEGINSEGREIDHWMPRYLLSREQSNGLIDYLKILDQEPVVGVDDVVLQLATVIDPRVSEELQRQHIAFLEALVAMRNANTRNEVRRKGFAPIQKKPQYEAYRRWQLSVWRLPEDPEKWRGVLQQKYDEQPPFFLITPLLANDYTTLNQFCDDRQLPCLFPLGAVMGAGSYYNFVFRNSAQRLSSFLRKISRDTQQRYLYFNRQLDLLEVDNRTDGIPELSLELAPMLGKRLNIFCSEEGVLLVRTIDPYLLSMFENKLCLGERIEPRVVVIPAEDDGFYAIKKYLDSRPNSKLCWLLDYNEKLFENNRRRVRIDLITKRYGIEVVDDEYLAKLLYAFSLSAEVVHQLAAHFSRHYFLEVMEHMLNSFPNYTYYKRLSGAPGQRSVVGASEIWCPEI